MFTNQLQFKYPIADKTSSKIKTWVGKSTSKNIEERKVYPNSLTGKFL